MDWAPLRLGSPKVVCFCFQLHVFDTEDGGIPREVCGLFAKDTLRLNLSSIQLR